MKSLIKNYIGKILVAMQPNKARELLTKGMTIHMNLSIKNRLMRYTLLEKEKIDGDEFDKIFAE